MRSRGRSFWALLVAESVSTTGSQLTNVALPWFVLTTSGSATHLGIVLTAELVGVGVVGIPAGTVAARAGPRRTMLACDAFRAPTIALIPLLHALGVLSLPILAVIAFAHGAALSPYLAAQRTILPRLSEAGEHRVGERAALLQAATRAALLIGPAVGGVLVAAFGAANTLVIDAATFVVAFVLVAHYVPPSAEDRIASTARLGDGVRQLFRDRLLALWTLALSVSEAAFQALIVALPVLVYTRFDANPAVIGWLLSAFGAGALIGSLAAARFLRRTRPLRIARAAALAYGVPLWLVAIATTPLVTGLGLAAAGIANGLLNPSFFAVQTARVDPRHRAAAAAAFVTITLTGGAVGLAAAGPALQHVGVRPVLVAVAATMTLSALAILGLTAPTNTLTPKADVPASPQMSRKAAARD